MSLRRAPDQGWLAYYRELVGAWARRHALPHEAQDAAQDAATRMLASSQAGILDPKAYLFRATQNRLINEVRRQARHDGVSLEALADDDHPLLSDPDMSLRARELADALEAALAQLPLKKRQAFIYHRLEGYTHPEIAQRMGIAVNTVERYIMDTTRHVRARLQHFCPD